MVSLFLFKSNSHVVLIYLRGSWFSTRRRGNNLLFVVGGGNPMNGCLALKWGAGVCGDSGPLRCCCCPTYPLNPPSLVSNALRILEAPRSQQRYNSGHLRVINSVQSGCSWGAEELTQFEFVPTPTEVGAVGGNNRH